MSQSVEMFDMSGFDAASLYALSRVLRNEMLQADYRKWKFEGDFSTWKSQPLLEFFLRQMMFGPNLKNLKGERSEDADKCVSVVSQIIFQNTKSDKQMRIKK